MASVERGQAVVKVLDLGLALLADQGSAGGELTVQGRLMGTVDYMAPEQGGDSHNVDIRADIYSLGATLFKLLVGEAPFGGKKHATPIQKLTALATEEAPKVADRRPDVAPALAALVDRLLSKDPSQRPATPAELANALAPFCAGADLRRLIASATAPSPLAGEGRGGGSALASSSPPSEGGAGGVASGGIAAQRAQIQSAIGTDDALTSGSAETSPSLVAESRSSTDAQSSTALARATEGQCGAPAVPPDAAGGLWRWSRRRYVAAALAAAAAVVLLAVVIVIQTADGTVEISAEGGTLPDDVTVVLQGGGETIEITSKNNWTIKADHGDYEISVKGGNDQFEVKDKNQEKRLTVRRFGKAIVTIVRKSSAGTWAPSAAQETFFKALANLSREQQVEVIEHWLRESNPGFDGKFEHKAEDGKIVHVKLTGPAVKNIWPVVGLPQLKSLDLSGSAVDDIGPLSLATNLQSLDLTGTWALDLAPLSACKNLRVLNCTDTSITDLRPLAGLPVVELSAPVSGYNERACEVIRSLTKLEKLNGRPPAEFLARRAAVEELAKALPAFSPQKQVEMVAAKLKEFNPGFEGKIEESRIEGNAVVHLDFFPDQITDISPVHALPSLRLLKCQLSAWQGRPAPLADLSPVHGLELQNLNFTSTRVYDFGPLAGLPLTHLECSNTPASDLSPLRGMKLNVINCNSMGRLRDLSPLAGMPLEYIDLRSTAVTDLSPLAQMPLKTINGQPAEEFWKEVEKKQ
ncbi:MAG: hypothetical protein HYS13_03355 [Planctomycetia bacterium]|nr:hypothetical protein [Planctomycetia bacterium]